MGSACWESGDARRDVQEMKVAITPSTRRLTLTLWQVSGLGGSKHRGLLLTKRRGAKDCGQSVSQSVRGVRYFE